MKEGSSSINHSHLRFIFLFLRNTPYICGWEEVTLIWFCSVTLSCQPRAEIFFKIVNILLISCYSHTLMITTQSLFIIVTCTTIIITIIIHFITLDVVVLLSVLVELMLSAVDVAPAPLSADLNHFIHWTPLHWSNMCDHHLLLNWWIMSSYSGHHVV